MNFRFALRGQPEVFHRRQRPLEPPQLRISRWPPFTRPPTKDFASGESTAVLFEHHRQELLASAPNYASVEFGPARGETVGLRNYVHLEYSQKPTSGDCFYHVAEHTFRARFYPARDYGFIVAAGVCENDRAFYQKQRLDILASFEQID